MAIRTVWIREASGGYARIINYLEYHFVDIHALKLSLIQQLLATDSTTVLEKIQALIEREKKDWWDELTPEQQEALEVGMKQARTGDTVSYQEVQAAVAKTLAQ